MPPEERQNGLKKVNAKQPKQGNSHSEEPQIGRKRTYDITLVHPDDKYHRYRHKMYKHSGEKHRSEEVW